MKYIVVCLIFCLTTLVYADNCRVFGCGNVIQPAKKDASRICVIKEGATTNIVDQKWRAAPWPESQRCLTDGSKWENPSTVEDRAVWDSGTDPIFPNLPKLVDGASLAGDYCTQDSHCFKGDTEQVKCQDNTWTTTLGPGSDCEDIKECPQNYYWSEDKKCTLAIAHNYPCSATKPCQYGMTWAAYFNPLTDFYCKLPKDFEESIRFNIIQARPNSIVNVKNDAPPFVYADVWDTEIAFVLTGEAFKDAPYQCRKGNRTSTQNLEDLRKDLGDACKFTSTSDQDPSNYKSEFERSYLAQCGFNIDEAAYCSVQIGDNYVLTAITDARAKMSIPNKNCHPLSATDENGVALCNSAFSERNNTEYFEAQRRVQEAISGQYYLTANNDNWVAKTITQQFWRGRFGSSAVHISIISTVSIFAFILTFFY